MAVSIFRWPQQKQFTVTLRKVFRLSATTDLDQGRGIFCWAWKMTKKVIKSEKQKRVEYFEKQRAYQKEIYRYAKDILHSSNFLSSAGHIQHGNVSVKDHSMKVARKSLEIADALQIRCNRNDLVRGALLHDYFLYDWHHSDAENPHRLHGFFHPSTALRNAKKEYELSKRQQDIIKHHMWPLTPKPPLCVEGWIVTTADKICSFKETVNFRKHF